MLLRHSLRNVLIPLMTMLGMDLGYFLGGVVVIESVFGLPGVGKLTFDAIGTLDIPMITGAVLFAAIFIVRDEPASSTSPTPSSTRACRRLTDDDTPSDASPSARHQPELDKDYSHEPQTSRRRRRRRPLGPSLAHPRLAARPPRRGRRAGRHRRGRAGRGRRGVRRRPARHRLPRAARRPRHRRDRRGHRQRHALRDLDGRASRPASTCCARSRCTTTTARPGARPSWPQSKGLKTKLGFTFRYAPAVQYAKQPDRRRLRRPAVHLQRLRAEQPVDRPGRPRCARSTRTPIPRCIATSSIEGYGAPIIDIMHWWIGADLTSVVGTMRNFVPERMVRDTGAMQRLNIDDGDMWIAEFDNGVLASHPVLVRDRRQLPRHRGAHLRLRGRDHRAAGRGVRHLPDDQDRHEGRGRVRRARDPAGVLPGGRTLARGVGLPVLLQPLRRLRHRDPLRRRRQPGRLRPGRAGAGDDQRVREVVPHPRLGATSRCVDGDRHERPHAWGDLGRRRHGRAISRRGARRGRRARADYADVAAHRSARSCGSYTQLRRRSRRAVENNIGIGVRVLVDGSWGFAARPVQRRRRRGRRRPPGAGHRAARLAVTASRSTCRRSRRRAAGTDRGRRSTRSRSTAAARHDLLAAGPGRRQRTGRGRGGAGRHQRQAAAPALRQHRGLPAAPALHRDRRMLWSTAAGHGDVQRRSYPNSFHGNTAAAGWEYCRPAHGSRRPTRVGEEAVALLTAPIAPAGHADVVIGAQQVALQIHESAGHALELDRILGDEANYAGTSFITGERRRVAAVRLARPSTSRPTRPCPAPGAASRFDDEGTPGPRQRADRRRASCATRCPPGTRPARSGLAN